MTVRMRYSEFVELRTKLALGYPHAKNSMPALPPKSALCRSSCFILVIEDIKTSANIYNNREI